MTTSKRIRIREIDDSLRRKILKPKITRTVFGLPVSLKKAMDLQVIRDGYGLRGKSRWIRDAVDEFLDPASWSDIAPEAWKRVVIDVESLSEETVKEGYNIDEKMRIRLWKAALEAMIYGAEQEDPIYIELSVQSILRAAVSWKLSRAS